MTLGFPDGRRFAFTIMDDTDVSTRRNVGPVYRLLADLGFRTTKTVWPVACPEGSKNFADSETLEDPDYLDFVHSLAAQGFEIAFHGATMETSTRERTAAALRRFRELFGGPPKVYANHAQNREGLYWGVDRLDHPLLRAAYGLVSPQQRGFYQGHVAGSPWWWSDLAAEISYIRNLTFTDINVLAINPSMPYTDPRRPAVRWWFSAADADDVEAFNRLIAPDAQERLERDGGVCIVATHLGKRFCEQGQVHPRTVELLTQLSTRNGWFVPVGTLLDWLRSQRGTDPSLPPGEWRRMQWRWALDLLGARMPRWRPRQG